MQPLLLDDNVAKNIETSTRCEMRLLVLTRSFLALHRDAWSARAVNVRLVDAHRTSRHFSNLPTLPRVTIAHSGLPFISPSPLHVDTAQLRINQV
jgi:hypothetical protein